VERIQSEVPDLKITGDKKADLLVIGWGSSYGHILTAVTELIEEGYTVAATHFNYIRPLPKNCEEVFSGYKKLVVCELNNGQFANYLRMKYQKFTFTQYNKIQGLPFTVREIKDHCITLLEGK
jgi:2-oxoglutarate ferredoxin oxidoreductase subunit alpha